jgi:hypothetical protein
VPDIGHPPNYPPPSRQSYFRVQAPGRDASALLEADHQETRPWGGADSGPCEKCDGSGVTTYECGSCAAGGPDLACPVCGGRVRFEEECPACRGSGEVDHASRAGVSVFPDEEALYRYLLAHDARLEEGMRLLELEGEPTDEPDFDADEGALLIRPTRIVGVRPLDRQRLASTARG